MASATARVRDAGGINALSTSTYLQNDVSPTVAYERLIVGVALYSREAVTRAGDSPLLQTAGNLTAVLITLDSEPLHVYASGSGATVP